MKITWRSELLQLVVIGAMFVVAIVCWPHAPQRMPIHWNLQGEVDGYGGKFAGLILMPLITLSLCVLLVLLPLVDPGRRNYASFATAYHVIRNTLVCVMASIYAVLVLASFGHQIDVAAVTSLAAGMLLITIGNLMGKIRPNWFIGVRTPWTLSSKASWDKTNRAGGWVIIALGLLIAAAGIVRTMWMLVALLACTGVSVLSLVVYSYVVYRNDPDRTSPAGTSPGNH